MFKIQTLNKISKSGLKHFNRENYTVGDNIDKPDAIIVRSAKMNDMTFDRSLRGIARAGAGVDNIPVDRCSEEGIVVFNTPGANANAVKELVVAGLILASRNIISAVEWTYSLKGKGDEKGDVKKLVEDGKSQFVGCEIKGKKIAVIGLGAIGVLVANAAHRLDMDVYGYDPYLSVDSAWGLSSNIHRSSSLDEILASCDYISLNLPANSETKGLINADKISKMKDGVKILNFARDTLCVDDDIIAGLQSKKISRYVTDFPYNEKLIKVDGVIAIPHLGASTPESEENCADMAAREIIDFLETGSIKNSVNFPDVNLPAKTGARITVIHRNIPAMLTQISGAFQDAKINIDNMVSLSKKDFSYAVLDLSPGSGISGDILKKLETVEGVIRVTVI